MMKRIFKDFLLFRIIPSMIASYIVLKLSERDISVLSIIKSWQFYVLAFVALVIFLCTQLVISRAKFRGVWEVCKPTRKITPGDFRIQGYRKAYIYRQSDAKIRTLLRDRSLVLIMGKPKAGKTRLAYEVISRLDDFLVIRPPSETVKIEKVKFPLFGSKNFILLFDDLKEFVGTNAHDIVNDFPSGVLV